jgi:predicted AAA+ superfamily ATPase
MASADLRSNLIATYLERDIPQLGFRIPAETLRRFFTMLAHLQGSVLNAAALARSLGVDGKTIAHYIDLFTDLLLVRRLPPWHANIKKRLVKSPKLYLRDSGLLHTLLGVATYDTLAGHPIYGFSWEGFVIEQIHAVLPRYGASTSYYRTSTGDEIDLVVDLPSNARLAIEIKASEVAHHTAGFIRGADVVGATHRYVVYHGTERYPLNDKTEAIGIADLVREIVRLVER